MTFAKAWTPPPKMRDSMTLPPKPTRWLADKPVAALLRPAPKPPEPARSKAYLRLVASYPCKACGIAGYSQAAHVPPDTKGRKQDDRMTMPLCCTRPGITGCHVDYDQYRIFPADVARTVGKAWAADTRRQIEASGKWPKKLPRWEE